MIYMSGKVLTYPIVEKVSKEALDELVHYSSYRRLKKLKGEDVEVCVITTGLSEVDIENIKSVDSNFKIINTDDYLDYLNDFIGFLYDEKKLKVIRKSKFYCSKCDSYYPPNVVEFKEKEEVFNIVRVRIGRRLYFIDKLPQNTEPVGVAINDNEDLIYINMDKETWVSPKNMKEILVRDIEIPEEEIKYGKIENIRKRVKLTGYVTTGNVKTGYITKENVDMFNLQKVISSYSVIYSVSTVVRRAVCPKCGETLQEVVVPKLVVDFEGESINLSSERGAYKIPILYCDSCGHIEYGTKIRDCPVCGNVMNLSFYYDPLVLPLGAYFKEEKESEAVAFLHEKRRRFEKLDKILWTENKRRIERKILLKHYIDDEFSPDGLLLKKRGSVGKSCRKMDKIRNVLRNLVNYMEIYGRGDVREIVDSWIVYRAEKIKRDFFELIENGNFAHAFQIYYEFVVEDLSHLYVGIRRKEPIVERAVVDAIKMLYVFDEATALDLLKKLDVEDLTLSFEEVPEVKGMEVARDVIRRIMKFRTDRDIPRREPLKKVVFVTEHTDEIKDFTSSIMKFTNVLVFNATDKWEEMELSIEPNLEAINRMYRAWAPKIAFLLKRKNVKEVMDALNKGGYTMGIEGFIIRITPDMVKYVEKVPKGYLKIKGKYGDIYVNSERDITTMRIRMVNEIIRRINRMRKDIEMEYDDMIDVSISTDDYVIRILKGYVDEIKERTRARKVDFEYIEYAYVVEWPVMDFDVVIGINPLFKKWVIKAFQSIPGIAENKAELLFHMGYGSIYELMQTPPSELAEIPRFSLNFANKIKDYLYSTAFKPKKEGDKEVCPFCGTELSKEDDFCPRCGAPIRVKIEKKDVEMGNVYIALGEFSKVATMINARFPDEKKLLITKEDPDRIKKDLGFKNTSVIWISYVPMGKSIKPKDINKLRDMIEKYLGKGVKIVMMDAFDFMVAINGLEAMYDFIKTIREDIKGVNALFIFNVEELEEEEYVEKIKELVDGKI